MPVITDHDKVRVTAAVADTSMHQTSTDCQQLQATLHELIDFLGQVRV